MRARTAVLLIILVALGIFAAVNWSTIAAPTTVHLLVTTVEAPIGVILFAVAVGLTLLFAIYVTWIETSALLETRRYTRELQAQRQLAEAAEASRYTELRTFLAGELAALRSLPEAAAQDVVARLESLEERLRADIDRTGNTLAAYFAELEERLNRGERPAPPGSPPR